MTRRLSGIGKPTDEAYTVYYPNGLARQESTLSFCERYLLIWPALRLQPANNQPLPKSALVVFYAVNEKLANQLGRHD